MGPENHIKKRATKQNTKKFLKFIKLIKSLFVNENIFVISPTIWNKRYLASELKEP